MGLAEVIGLAALVVAILIAAWQVIARRSDLSRAASQESDAKATAEVQVAEDLVRWLSDRRVLWTPIIKEIPEETIESVRKMRDRVVGVGGLLKHPDARRALETIRAACLELLDAPRPWFQTFFSPEAEAALIGFRVQVRPAVEELARVYRLDRPKWQDYSGGFEVEGVAIYIPGPDQD